MNLFRQYRQLKDSKQYHERVKLSERFMGKRELTEKDMEAVFEYIGAKPHRHLKADEITRLAFTSDSITEKIRHLKRLGIDVVGATTILMLQNPQKYAVADYKVWNRLLKERLMDGVEKESKSDYTEQEYKNYLSVLETIAIEYGMGVADVEYVLRWST